MSALHLFTTQQCKSAPCCNHTHIMRLLTNRGQSELTCIEIIIKTDYGNIVRHGIPLLLQLNIQRHGKRILLAADGSWHGRQCKQLRQCVVDALLVFGYAQHNRRYSGSLTFLSETGDAAACAELQMRLVRMSQSNESDISMPQCNKVPRSELHRLLIVDGNRQRKGAFRQCIDADKR